MGNFLSHVLHMQGEGMTVAMALFTGGKWRGADRRGKGVNWVRLDATPQVLAW